MGRVQLVRGGDDALRESFGGRGRTRLPPQYCAAPVPVARLARGAGARLGAELFSRHRAVADADSRASGPRVLEALEARPSSMLIKHKKDSAPLGFEAKRCPCPPMLASACLRSV